MSDAVRSSITGTGAFLFFISGAAKQSNDAGIRHNHRAQALVFGGLGAEPTNKLFAIRPGFCILFNNQFTPDEVYDNYPADRLMHDIALALMAVQTQTTEVLDSFPTIPVTQEAEEILQTITPIAPEP